MASVFFSLHKTKLLKRKYDKYTFAFLRVWFFCNFNFDIFIFKPTEVTTIATSTATTITHRKPVDTTTAEALVPSITNISSTTDKAATPKTKLIRLITSPALPTIATTKGLI